MASGLRFGRTKYLSVVAGALLALVNVAACAQEGQAIPTPAAKTQDNSGAGTNETVDGRLTIEPPELPNTYQRGPYQVALQVRGNYVPGLRWRVYSGALPAGIKLEENGVLHGQAERTGIFQFVVLVKDSGQPQQSVQKGYTIKVVEAITLAWKNPPHVVGGRIEGSVEASNTTVDDIDLTFDAKAVAENGRATEIGYQHFPLRRGTIGMVLPFGENLPHGAYMIYVNVNGEVPKRNAIYKEQLQTPAPLQVTVGP